MDTVVPKPSRRRTSAIPEPKLPIDVEEAARLLAQGLTYVAIGAKLGYRPSSIRRRLLEHGVRPKRKHSRRTERWGDKLYFVWRSMRQRAGARGTYVSEEWVSFDAFYDWARSSGYRPGLVLARRDQTGAFTPGNCRWGRRTLAPRKKATTQSRKRLTEKQWKRVEKLHLNDGLSCPAIAKKLGVSHGAIRRGLKLRGSYKRKEPGITGTETGRKLRQSWYTMQSRCNNPRDPSYCYYGGKGARVSRQWDEFEAFYEWALEAGWQPGLCLVRVARARVFSPVNCRWVTRSEAARNAHHPNSKMPPQWTVTAFGETKGPTAWSRDRRCTVTLAGLIHRLRGGWDPEAAIATPPQCCVGPPPTRFVTAFGQTKSVTEWVNDRRCKITLVTLLRRLERGIPPEEAIAAKPYGLR